MCMRFNQPGHYPCAAHINDISALLIAHKLKELDEERKASEADEEKKEEDTEEQKAEEEMVEEQKTDVNPVSSDPGA